MIRRTREWSAVDRSGWLEIVEVDDWTGCDLYTWQNVIGFYSSIDVEGGGMRV